MMNLQPGTDSLSCSLHKGPTFFPSSHNASHAHIKNFQEYEKLYMQSIEDSDRFWLDQAGRLEWMRAPTQAREFTWDTANRMIEHSWFKDGEINCCVNCLDRHLSTHRRDQAAIIWQGEEEDETKVITFLDLYHEVCRLSNALRSKGVRKGDRVCIYMPMIPEAVTAMLACARIGAIHVVVFGGFAADSLAHRIQDAQAKVIITANVGLRGGKKLYFKKTVDAALASCPSIQTTIVVKRTNDSVDMGTKDVYYNELIATQSSNCPPEPLNAEDPLFILHTSGSTGKPKGVLHTQAGYLLHASLSHFYIFDVHKNDVYWCTADIGWITGHSYVVYGPLSNGCTTLLFEGTPTYPDPGRYWKIIEKFKVTTFYTAPTALRAAISKGDSYPKSYNLGSLRLLGTVGEPINPDVWLWYRDVIGHNECPIMDTWWQTETGGILITPLPGAHTLKPGSASRPFFGVEPIILRDDRTQCHANEGGSLCIKKPWPGMMRTLWNDHERFINTYFSKFADCYFSGDGGAIDEEGDFWLLGRMDDVANVSGHRIGTAEVESALVGHPSVAEAAVVPVSDAIKGEKLYAYIILIDGTSETLDIKSELGQRVRKAIGGIAVPDQIQFTPNLPKTRSGKIMRRILKLIAEGRFDDLGDTTTLADPTIIDVLIQGQKSAGTSK